MPEIVLQNDGCTSLGSIDSGKGLEPQEGLINISPRRSDVRCDCCGRHIDELKPFGKAGDPLVGDFDGELLVDRSRPWAPRDEEAERIYEEYLDRARRKFPYGGAPPMTPADDEIEEAERIRLHFKERIVQKMPAAYSRKKAERIRREVEGILTDAMRAGDQYREEAELMRLGAKEREEQLLAADYATEEAEPITLVVEEKVADPMFGEDYSSDVRRRIDEIVEKASQLMAQDYGMEEADRIAYVVLCGRLHFGKPECRDCIVLSNEEYFEKRDSRMKAEL